MVVTPSKEMMAVALELGMPTFKIIEVPIKNENEAKKRKINQEQKSLSKGAGSIELFSHMNKEAI